MARGTGIWLLAVSAIAQSGNYFVDCSAATNGDGAKASPWNSLSPANEHPFVAGDAIQFRRATTCTGKFKPQGSGRPGMPIRVRAYGEGPRPKIVPGPSADSGFSLHDQQGWEIEDLDIHGGATYGVVITAELGLMRHIVLRNLDVHDAGGTASTKASGAIVITATEKGAAFEDVLLDGVQAHNVTQWSGIFVSGQDGTVATRHVTVRNSLVHDVAGDGIVLFGLEDGLIDHSVAYRTGLALSNKVGTPNAIWAWKCLRCTVQNNEAFLTDSPGIDGGAFDIDWANTENTVQRNFGHDTQGYCVAVFAAFGETRDSSVDDNLCIANGLSPRLAMRQGAIFLMTWNNGVASNVRIHNNRVFWDPPCSCPAVKTGEAWNASDVSISANLIDATTGVFFSPGLKFQGKNDLNSFLPKPTGARLQLRGSVLDPARQRARSGTLSLSLPDLDSNASHAALLVLVSMAAQYHSLGVKAELHVRASATRLAQVDEDWHLRNLGIAVDSKTAQIRAPRLYLKIPGRPTGAWSSPLDFRAVGLELRSDFGTPVFSSVP